MKSTDSTPAHLPMRTGSAFEGLTRALNAIGSVWIGLIMLLIMADVLLRFFFNSPISGVPTMIEISIVAIVFLQVTETVRQGRMIRSDALINRLHRRSPVLAAALETLFSIFGLTFMSIALYFGMGFLGKSWARETYVGLEGAFIVPEWPVKLIILIGAAVCCIQLSIDTIKNAHSMLKNADGDIRALAKPIAVIAAIAGGLVGLFLFMSQSDMSGGAIGLISVSIVLAMVHLGMPVSYALAVISFACIWILRDSPIISGKLIAIAVSESLARYEFGVIPLFILMGFLVSLSGAGREIYEVAASMFRRVRGGVGMATVGASGVFAAVTGTSLASASVFTKVAVPEMLRIGYRPRFAVGVVAGSSVLGMLIPPSLMLIVFGILSETSVGDLFLAGVIPGIILAVAYCILIRLMAGFFPDKVGTEEALSSSESTPLSARETVAKSGPVVILLMAIVGGIYGGIFTATEAGAVGAFGALIMVIAKGKFSWKGFWDALAQTGYTTAGICLLMVAAHIYSRMITISGIPRALSEFIAASGFGFNSLLSVYVALIIVLGTVLDAGSIMLLLVPLAVTAMAAFDVNLVWLGIVTTIGVEIGLLTPPLGLSCFVIKSNLNDKSITVGDVFWGAAPYALTMLFVLLLVILFPSIVLLLV